MSKIMISELETATEVLGTDWIAIDNGEYTKKIAVEDFEETAANSARSYAEAAAASAEDAADSAEAASTTASEVSLQINRAVSLVGQAEEYATAAGTSAGQASTSATTARTQAGIATTKANEAAQSASQIGNAVELAQSWAEGGTGARPDEAVNNAKYWAETAKAIAGGGVVSFNGRGGIVVPQSGDYDSTMIPHTSGQATTTVAAEINGIQSEINGIQSEITNIQSEITALDKIVVQSGTLLAGNTSLAFTVTGLTNDSLVSVYADTFGVSPTNIAVSGTTITLTFEAQQANVGISIQVYTP